ncbi:hypothetical protein [Acinetobacter sp. CIP 102136]|uniref:Bbp19 family protein n=1 Tax=Acinetobacter sp. CIP 102136 TaxID=1144665 RepID=UPI0002CF6CDB|nr:hypothetical protein [Acinetobacter sp. CIP 102136]ENX21078.1 hypothetical protein F893_01959 [Acinetobacter sp. CIP 102136]
MILIIAVLAILLLIACYGWWNCYRSKQLVEAVSEFNKNAVNEIQIWLYEEKQTVEALKNELANLKAQPDQEFKELVQEQEDELGFGHHVKWRSHRKPTALTYQMHFDMDVNGQRILEELTVRFKRNAFTDNERETCRRLGRAEVVDFIINRINTANDPRYDESLELAHMEQNNE